MRSGLSPVAPGVEAKEPYARLHVLDRRGERLPEPVVQRRDRVALRQQLSELGEVLDVALVAIDEAAAVDVNDQRRRFKARGRVIEVEPQCIAAACAVDHVTKHARRRRRTRRVVGLGVARAQQPGAGAEACEAAQDVASSHGALSLSVVPAICAA
jgi:hypothetical protein